MVDVSVVIVSYNTKNLLDKCLASVFADSPSISREVIVVENASSDGSLELLSAKWPQVKVLRNEENVGYARGCNQGLRAASGRYKLALNSDAFLEEVVLRKLVDFMDENAEVAAVGPKLLNGDGSLQRTCARRQFTYPSQVLTFTPLGNLRSLRRYVHRFEPEEFYASTNRAAVLSGACILFRTDMLEKISLLDERLILNCDDVEWCSRANRMGYVVMYYPEAEVVHLAGESRSFDPEGMHTKNIESIANFFDIMYPGIPALLLKTCMAANIVPTLLKNAVLAPIAASRRVRASLQWKLLRKNLQVLVHRCTD